MEVLVLVLRPRVLVLTKKSYLHHRYVGWKQCLLVALIHHSTPEPIAAAQVLMQWRWYVQGAAKSSSPLTFFAVFSATAWNLKGKFYTHV